MDISQQYNNLRPPTFEFPIPFIPIPQDSNYDAGYISRAFCLKMNTGTAIEISPAKKTFKNGLYKIAEINWRITGKRNVTISNGILTDTGVFEYNLQQISYLKGLGFVSIGSVLSDPLQFWRGF